MNAPDGTGDHDLRYVDALALIAAEVLGAYEHLRDINAVGSGFQLGADDLPLDAAGWSRWYDHAYSPAAARLDQALDALEAALGAAFPGRRPRTFLDICHALLSTNKKREAMTRRRRAKRPTGDHESGSPR
ncbi:MAG: hypothetical protein ACRCYQ_01925 [Nocardioides sp.]